MTMRINAPGMMRDLPLRIAAANVQPSIIRSDDEDGAFPADLRNWLVRLRLLEGVPFAHLVADTELLPEESIRWFYVDRSWTDALVQGALSVGTVNSDDRTQLSSAYGAIRDELDSEERNLRRSIDELRRSGAAGPISGFLLRSRAVAGYPGLHVRAFDAEPLEEDDDPVGENDPRRMRLLRLERLAPAVLLCLFDGIPEVVHLEEPRQGIQFGFRAEGNAGSVSAHLPLRNVSTFKESGTEVRVKFRSGSSGVVDIQQLERELKAADSETGVGPDLDAAEYALQLIRFPFRQVWGDVDQAEDLAVAFTPTIVYETLVSETFQPLTLIDAPQAHGRAGSGGGTERRRANVQPERNER